MRIGVEVEYWLVDGDGALAPADDIAAACEGAHQEFVEPLLEVTTPPCDSLEALVTVLAERIRDVHDVARSYDRRLVPTGTPLADEVVRWRPGTRTDVQRAVIGDDFHHATHCAGTHVHFEQVSTADQLRVLTALDPAFALVNTSPYYRGRRTAACARPHVYRRRCYRNRPELGQLWRYPESADEWRERLEARFDAFVAAADRAGVGRGTVESAFSRADAVWAPVRLRDDLGTVEWRAPDTAPPLDLCRIVRDVHRVVERATERGVHVAGSAAADPDAVTVPTFETLRGHVDAAMERGLAAERVERYLERLGFDPGEYRPVGVRIDGREALDADTARRLRARAADRLETELRRLSEEGLGAVDDAPAPVST